MVTSLVFNLLVDRPVDWKYIGRDALLPVRKHKLQRLFNRKVHESMVTFDADGQEIRPDEVTKEMRDAWKQGGLNIHWEVPRSFRERADKFNKIQCESLREKRRLFSPRMSGMDLVTLGSIPYSYYYNIRLRPYAHAFTFSHRLLGYIRIPGLPCLEKIIRDMRARGDVNIMDTTVVNMPSHAKEVVTI